MQTSTLRRALVALIVAVPLAVIADGKATRKKHPNLAAAQKLTQQAFDKLQAAQKANEYDLGGHAQKAKELLKQASEEIKLASEKADQ